MDTTWVPLERVGEFRFGSDISEYLSTNKTKAGDIADPFDLPWDNYLSADELLNLYVEEGKIASIGCYVSCVWNGVELIGLSVTQFCDTLGVTEVPAVELCEVIDDIQEVYQFDGLEAQVWVKDERIECMLVGPRIEEEV